MGASPKIRSWQRNRVFRFLSSVKLAVVLIAVVIIASATGTICESRFDTKVARAYVYEAPWFNAWMMLLAVNLAAAALSRYPWKKHHAGFLITHAGIITLLVGAVIGRVWGIEGTMTLFIGDEPVNRLVLDQQEVRIRIGDQVEHFPVGVSQRHEHPSSPIALGRTTDGWQLDVVDYAEKLQANSTAEVVTSGGAPAVRIRLWNAGMGQQFEQWLWPDDPDNSKLDLGLLAVEVRRGTALAAAATPKIEKISGDQGALAATSDRAVIYYGDDGAITYHLSSKSAGESNGTLKTSQPLVTHWSQWQLEVEQVMPMAAPSTDFQPVPAGAKLTPQEKMNVAEGLKIRFTKGDESYEEWVASGWQVGLPTQTTDMEASYGLKIYPLPISIQLKQFDVERNEGQDTPAGFKSTLLVQDADGNSGTGSCSMNEPMSFPAGFWRTCTGNTYKISQASWNPDNLKQSSVQILNDPGWLFKWTGSLMICCGIFTMFYLRPPRLAHPL